MGFGILGDGLRNGEGLGLLTVPAGSLAQSDAGLFPDLDLFVFT